MKTLFDEQQRNGLMSRIERVTAETRPTWGKMNAERMLTHLVESMRMAIGELQTRPKNLFIRFAPFRQLFVYVLPWPKGVPTAPELIPSDSRNVDDSKRELARLCTEFGKRNTREDWPYHPAFGELGRKGWGVLAWRHIDHHLRQFGL
ncbi:MAG TPA: DUF1569 domain-containing protein [Thermoanaerobaculia bacterium]|jgi:hypothetical protein